MMSPEQPRHNVQGVHGRSLFDVARDGTLAYFDREPIINSGTGQATSPVQISTVDLWALDLEGDGQPVPVAATPADERHGQISPDGKWLAYASNETDAEVYEIYVRSFPSGPARFQPSTDGGDWPRWHPDGDRLFFLGQVGYNRFARNVPLSAVDVTVDGAALDFTNRPRPVIRIMAFSLAHPGGPYSTYAIGPDGERLLVYQRAPPVVEADATPTFNADSPERNSGLVIARNWEAGLERR